MKDVQIVGVTVEGKEIVVSLLGGTDNVVGTLRFFEKDSIKLHELRRRAESLMNGNVLVDIAYSLSGGRWRLIGKNRQILGGLEPTKLDISQTFKQQSKKEDKGNGEPGWGLGWPEAWGGES